MQNERNREPARPERPGEPAEPGKPQPQPEPVPQKRIDYGDRDSGVVSPDNWVNPWDKEQRSEGER